MVFVGFGGLEADFGSLEELLAELLAGWMAANPSRPSLLNKILLTPFCVLTVFVSPTSFFQLLWSESARALPLRPPPPAAGASRRYNSRRFAPLQNAASLLLFCSSYVPRVIHCLFVLLWALPVYIFVFGFWFV